MIFSFFLISQKIDFCELHSELHSELFIMLESQFNLIVTCLSYIIFKNKDIYPKKIDKKDFWKKKLDNLILINNRLYDNSTYVGDFLYRIVILLSEQIRYFLDSDSEDIIINEEIQICDCHKYLLRIFLESAYINSFEWHLNLPQAKNQKYKSLIKHTNNSYIMTEFKKSKWIKKIFEDDLALASFVIFTSLSTKFYYNIKLYEIYQNDIKSILPYFSKSVIFGEPLYLIGMAITSDRNETIFDKNVDTLQNLYPMMYCHMILYGLEKNIFNLQDDNDKYMKIKLILCKWADERCNFIFSTFIKTRHFTLSKHCFNIIKEIVEFYSFSDHFRQNEIFHMKHLINHIQWKVFIKSEIHLYTCYYYFHYYQKNNGYYNIDNYINKCNIHKDTAYLMIAEYFKTIGKNPNNTDLIMKFFNLSVEKSIKTINHSI